VAMAAASHPDLCRCMHKRLNQKKGTVRVPKPPCIYASLGWLRDIDTLLVPYHDRMLHIAYRKPDTGTLSFLMGKEVRTAAPLVARELSRKEQEAADHTAEDIERHEREEKEEDEMWSTLHRVLGPTRGGASEAFHRYKLHVGNDKEARDTAKKQASADAQSVAFVFNFLTPCQFRALSRLIEAGGPAMELSDVLPFFAPHFGLDENTDADVIDYMLTLIHHHRNGTVTKHERMRQIVHLQQSAPHAYNLMQVAAELLKNQQRTRASVVGFMNAGATAVQMAALLRKSKESIQVDDMLRVATYDKLIPKAEAKTRKDPHQWGLLPDQLRADRQLFVDRIAQTEAAFNANPMIGETMAHLYACAVCSTVFSNVRDAHTSKRKYYRWGLRSAEYNYSTNTLHCYNNKINHMGHCATTPLHRVNLIGVRFALEKKAYQLCARCGDIMSPSASTGECTDWGGQGLICYHCTRLYRKELSSGENDPAAVWFKQLGRDCVCCGAPTRTEKHTYLYPFDLVVCFKHANTRLLRFVKAVQASQMHDRESAQKTIRDYWVKTRAYKWKAVARRGVRFMKANRQKNNQRKA